VNSDHDWSRRHRLALGRRIAPGYLRNPKVAAVLVAGSVGRGIADDFSDLELDIFWSAPPDEAERRAPIEAVAAELRAIHPFEQDEWAETFLVAGVKVDTSMFLVETVEGYLTDLVDHAHPDHDKQVLVAAVLDAIPLHGRALVNRWRARAAAYPDALARAMVARHLAGLSGWRHAEVLAARRDLVFLYDVVGQAIRALLGMLLGLNRRYLPHPRFKWLDQLVAGMSQAPADLASRLRTAYQAEPAVAVRELRRLLVETLQLVERHLPEVDTAPGWAAVAGNRAS
jgi:hypothetical protein